MSGRNILGCIILLFVAAVILVPYAAKYGIVDTALTFAASVGLASLVIFGFNLALDDRP